MESNVIDHRKENLFFIPATSDGNQANVCRKTQKAREGGCRSAGRRKQERGKEDARSARRRKQKRGKEDAEAREGGCKKEDWLSEQ